MIKSIISILFVASLGSTVSAADLSGLYQTNGCVNYEGQNKTLWSWIASINLSYDGKIVVSDEVYEGSDCKTPNLYFISHKFGTYEIKDNKVNFTMTSTQFLAFSKATAALKRNAGKSFLS